MFPLTLPRFFGFSSTAGDREDPPARDVRSRHQKEAVELNISESEESSRRTAIAGRLATEVVSALRGNNIDEARQALSDIYLTYFETLWRFAYRWTQSRSHAQELVHDIFLAVWTRRTTFPVRADGEIIFYLRSALRKKIYDEAKHSAIVTRLESAVERHTVDLPAVGQVVDPELSLEEAETKRIITTALATISPRDRDVFTMRWIDRMTLEEIASELGVSKTRIRNILARAMAKLAPGLESLRDG